MSSVDWNKELQAFEAWATALHFSIGAYVPQGDCFAAKFLADETQGAWNAWKFRILEQLMAYDYASNLATSLHRKHFSAHADWEPLPDTLGVLTQIDNMTAAWKTADETADKIIADYKEHYSFPPQGESHMHDCIMMALCNDPPTE